MIALRKLEYTPGVGGKSSLFLSLVGEKMDNYAKLESYYQGRRQTMDAGLTT